MGSVPTFFIAAIRLPVAAVQRDSSNRNGATYGSAVAVGGDLIRNRCPFVWGRGRVKDAKGFGQVVGGFLGAFEYCHRNFHLSNEKQSPTSPPNFLGSDEGGCIRFIQEWQEIATRRQEAVVTHRRQSGRRKGKRSKCHRGEGRTADTIRNF